MSRDTRILPCILTEAELAQRRDQLATVVGQIVEVENAKALATKQFSDQLKSLGSSARTYAKQIRDRAEDRSVEVEEVQDPVRFCVDTFRCDTHELISSRKMDDDEIAVAKQLTLPSVERARRAKRGVAVADGPETDGAA